MTLNSIGDCREDTTLHTVVYILFINFMCTLPPCTPTPPLPPTGLDSSKFLWTFCVFCRPSEDSATEEDYLFGEEELAEKTKKKRWISIYVMFFVIFLSAVSKSVLLWVKDSLEIMLLFSYPPHPIQLSL